MSPFQEFLQQIRTAKEMASELEADVHYSRLDAILNALAINQTPMTYRELGKALGVFSTRLTAMLNKRMEDDSQRSEPLFSAWIVNKETGKSSQGFFDKARSLGFSFADNSSFWLDQINGCIKKCEEKPMMCMILCAGLSEDEEDRVQRIERAIVDLLLGLGCTDRPMWEAEPVNGQRQIRLFTGRRTLFRASPEKLLDATDHEIFDQVRKNLIGVS